MKRNGKSRFLIGALVVVICAMWSSISFASLYSLDGYTGSFQTFGPAGNPLLDTTGYYHLDLVGGSYGTPTRVSGLTGTLSLFAANADGTRNTTSPLPPASVLFNSLLLDSFYLQYDSITNVLDLGSTLAGIDATLLSLSLSPPLPALPPLGYLTPFDLTTNANFFINNGNGYDANGGLTTGIYGSILAPGFKATYIDPLDPNSAITTPNTVNMIIDDTTYSTTNPAAVPEPSTFLLIGAGLAGLGYWRRRKA